VSHETIYRSLFIQTRGVLKKELLAHLRATRAIKVVLDYEPTRCATQTFGSTYRPAARRPNLTPGKIGLGADLRRQKHERPVSGQCCQILHVGNKQIASAPIVAAPY